MSEPAPANPSLPPHRTVRVDLGPRAYDVLIGRGLLSTIGDLLKACGSVGKIAIIADEQVATLFVNRLKAIFNQMEFSSFYLTVPSGEATKSIEDLSVLLSNLADAKLSRSGVVLALGGGVIGDLAGFAAAVYLRGINFVQVPTTLLAMVDSSVGGKTGVNLPEGKNLVGAFHQPKLVVADLDTLETLPPREFSAGMAEVIKYGAIRDKALFDRVAGGVKPSDADLDEIVEKCVSIKARIVERDEFETKGERTLLNFGHTLGHAIEKATGYGRFLHGEAIALGMRAAAWLSHWETGLPLAEVHALEAALVANGLPTHLDESDDSNALILVDIILKALGNDKKVSSDGQNRWVLLTRLGEAKTGLTIKPDVVEAALRVILAPLTKRDVP